MTTPTESPHKASIKKMENIVKGLLVQIDDGRDLSTLPREKLEEIQRTLSTLTLAADSPESPRLVNPNVFAQLTNQLQTIRMESDKVGTKRPRTLSHRNLA